MFGLDAFAVKLGLGVIALVIVAGWFAKSRYNTRKAAKNENLVETQQEIINAVDQAKRVEEAARSGTDPEWAERVRNKYRRK